MTQEVARLASLAIAPASRSTYTTAEKRYFAFCDLHRVDPLPGTDVTLSYFAADLARSLQPSSVRVYMSAIHNLHKEMDFPYPTKASALLTRVLRGISRSPSTDRARLPIPTPLLRQLCENVMRDENYVHGDRVMLKAAMSLAFHAFLRCGELVALHRDDVTLSRGISLAVRIRQSKTDQFGHGTVLNIGSSSDLSICPVRAVTAYLDQRRDSNPGLFVYGNNSPLRKDSLSSELRKLLPRCGVTNTQNYAGHSFRIGAATSAAMAGEPEWLIRRLGRWRSDTVYQYIRTDSETERRVSSSLATIR